MGRHIGGALHEDAQFHLKNCKNHHGNKVGVTFRLGVGHRCQELTHRNWTLILYYSMKLSFVASYHFL